MSTPSNPAIESPLDAPAPEPARRATRPLYWSIRREIWENRSVYLAPFAVAALVLFSFTVSALVRLPGRVRDLPSLDPEKQRVVLSTPYGFGASAILFASFVVALFYCVDALYGERRERTILFWKSLPVSDRTTVLAKVAVACVVLPAVGYAIAVGTQFLMLMVSTFVLIVSGVGPGGLWSRLPIVTMPIVMLYGLTAHVLWFAPIYGWLLFISGWARRTPILWAVLPPMAVMAMERILFGTTYLAMWVGYRFAGALREAFTAETHKQNTVVDRLAQLDPGRFLASAGLWTGLLIAAGLLLLTIRLRRYREPI
jgi:ABC-2 type transport system permease protein